MHFVAVSLKAELEHVMGGRGHRPVIVAQDTLVIVFQRLASDFGEEPGLFVLHREPALGKTQRSTGLSPNS